MAKIALKRRLFDTYVNAVAFSSKYLKSGDNTIDYVKYEDVPLCLVTISFNNAFLIEQQIRLIKKNIVDSQYVHIIADNSTDMDSRRVIKELCQKQGVEYVGLPYNWFQHAMYKPSYAHGLCMMWIYHNIIKKIKPQVFGFLDHDIFPTANYSILQKLAEQDFYGRFVERTPDSPHAQNTNNQRLWYLWAGFCFFRFKNISDKQINFFPCKIQTVYLDTAGSMYRKLYKNYSLSSLSFDKPVRAVYFRDGNNYHSDLLHYIDDSWLHTINGSNWTKGKSKDEFLREFLAQY